MLKPSHSLDAGYRGKPVAVAGGTSFIGSFLTAALVSLGAKVSVLSRTWYQHWRIQAIEKEIRWIQVDLSNPVACREALSVQPPQVLFNLVAHVETEKTLDHLPNYLQANFETTKNLLEGLITQRGMAKFVHVGSIGEYGFQKAPFVETQREIPNSPYAYSKLLATHLTLLFHAMGKLKTSVVRPAATFGPKDTSGRLVPNLIRACLQKRDFSMNPGEQIRDLIYVDDVVAGLLAAGATDKSNGEIINLGSPRGFRIKDVASLIHEMMGRPNRLIFGGEPYRTLDTMEFYMDSSKAKMLLDWEPKTDLQEGLRRTIEWHRYASF